MFSRISIRTRQNIFSISSSRGIKIYLPRKYVTFFGRNFDFWITIEFVTTAMVQNNLCFWKLSTGNFTPNTMVPLSHPKNGVLPMKKWFYKIQLHRKRSVQDAVFSLSKKKYFSGLDWPFPPITLRINYVMQKLIFILKKFVQPPIG